MPETHVPVTLFELDDWCCPVVVGPDARSFLQSFCTNDLTKLHPGQGCESFIPDIKGRILAHVLIFLEAQAVRMVSVPGSSQILVPHLRKYLLGNNAEVVDRTDETRILCLVGTEIGDLLQGTLGVELPSQFGNHTTVNTEFGPLLFGRVPLTCLPTVLILGSPEVVTELRNLWPAAVVPRGAAELFERLRIEAGFPWHGRDIGPENIAQEAARTEQAISFRKGCYLGQEPIARLDAMGHTNKELRCLVIDADQVSPGTDVRYQGSVVGRVSSASPASRTGKTVALAMIRAQANAPGTELTVAANGHECRAVVHWPEIRTLN